MTLINRAVWLTRFIAHQRILIHEQKKTIALLRELMDAKDHQAAQRLNHYRLEHLREVERIVSGWLISLERPEDGDELRHDLARLGATLGYQIAQLEEHVV